jgi:tellurite resistance protein
MPKAHGGRTQAQAMRSMEREAALSGRYDLMEAMIAACALIAHADGHVDAMERRRVMQLMRALPAFAAFSSEQVADEFTRHEAAFEYEPVLAREKALTAIEALTPHVSEVRMLLAACQHVLEADGICHPSEYQALRDIGKALGAA